VNPVAEEERAEEGHGPDGVGVEEERDTMMWRRTEAPTWRRSEVSASWRRSEVPAWRRSESLVLWRRSEAPVWRRNKALMWRHMWRTRRRVHGGERTRRKSGHRLVWGNETVRIWGAGCT
jgi:hypothetical protein